MGLKSEAAKQHAREYAKNYYQQHKEDLRVRAKSIYDADPDRLRKIAYDKYHCVDEKYKNKKLEYYHRKKQEIVDMKKKIIDLESIKH